MLRGLFVAIYVKALDMGLKFAKREVEKIRQNPINNKARRLDQWLQKRVEIKKNPKEQKEANRNQRPRHKPRYNNINPFSVLDKVTIEEEKENEQGKLKRDPRKEKW